MTARRPRSRSGRHETTGPSSLLIWRAMKWRAGSSVMFFVVAVAAVMAATAGPIYLRSADQSLVSGALGKAPIIETGVTLMPVVEPFTEPGRLLSVAESVPGGAGDKAQDRFGSPIVTVDVSTRYDVAASGSLDTIDFIARTGACAHIHVVSGHCPSGPDQVAISTRTAHLIGAHVGGIMRPVSAVEKTSGHADGKTAGPALVVAALYVAGNPGATFWWGSDYFPFGTFSKSTGELLDDGFMTLGGATALAPSEASSDWVQLPLRPSSVDASAVPGLLNSLAIWQGSLQSTAQSAGLVASSRLATVLELSESQEGFARTIITVISLQLLLLALLVLYAVARATSVLREPDVRVAQLRGVPRGRIVRLGLREPFILLVAAMPVGVVLTYLLLSTADRHILGPAAITGVDSLTIGAALGGGAAGLIAAALGSRGLFTVRTAPDGTSRNAKQRQTRNAAVLDALGLALAVAGIVELVGQSGHQQTTVEPVVYLGPGLVALGAGILAARLVPLAARGVSRIFQWSKRVAVTLASRDLARSAGIARQVLVPTIATGLLVFGIAGLAVADGNHATQAEFQLGAPFVVHVQPRPGVDFLTAVQQADPSGTEAMAVVDINGSDGRTLAVDTSRFAAIASWPAGLSSQSAESVARTMSPKVPPERDLAASDRIDVTISAATALVPPPEMQVTLFGVQADSESTIDLGHIEKGTHVYSSSLFGLCQSGCRIDEFYLSWDGVTVPPKNSTPAQRNTIADQAKLAAAYHITMISIASVRDGKTTPDSMDFSKSGTWLGSPSAIPTPSATGLELKLDLVSARGEPTFSPIDLPGTLTAVATDDTVALDSTPGQPSRVFPIGLDGTELTARPAVLVPVLPHDGNDASMMSLNLVQREQASTTIDASFQIWCKRAPSKALLARFESRGIEVMSISRATSALATIGRSGPSYGFDLYGLAAVGAGLLALGALLFSIASDTRERRIEFAGLSAIGVPRKTLLRSLIIESTAVSLTGVAVGMAAAVLSASLALRFLPEFPPGRIGPPLQVGLPWVDLVATGLAMFVLLETAAIAANVLLLRGVRPDLLRLSR
jgi:putative ABC transport system permease protein